VCITSYLSPQFKYMIFHIFTCITILQYSDKPGVAIVDHYLFYERTVSWLIILPNVSKCTNKSGDKKGIQSKIKLDSGSSGPVRARPESFQIMLCSARKSKPGGSIESFRSFTYVISQLISVRTDWPFNWYSFREKISLAYRREKWRWVFTAHSWLL